MKFIYLSILSFLLSFTAFAEETTTLNNLVETTLKHNPEIKAAISGWEASTKRPEQMGTLPNPVIGTKYKNVGFSEITQGDDPRSDLQIFIQQEIPFPGKLSAKEKIFEERSRVQKWQSGAVTRRVIAELKSTYYEWFLINKSIQITEKNKELLQKFSEISEVKYEVGKGIQQDVTKSQVEISKFVEKLELLKERKGIIEARLREITNIPPDQILGEPAKKLNRTELDITLNNLLERAYANSPNLNAKEQTVQSKDEELNLAEKGYYPDFIVSATYFNRDGGNADLNDIWEVGVGFKVPLYFWRKEKLGIEEAEIELRQAQHQYVNSKNEIKYLLTDLFLKAETSVKLLELYKTGIIPQAELSLDSAVSGYQVGDVDFLTLLDDLITLYTYELEYYKKLTRYQQSLAKMEELSGLELIGSADENPSDSGRK